MKLAFSKWTKNNFERIDHLWEPCRPLFREFLLRIAMAGVYVRIPDEGHKRTSEEQKELYERNPPVTWVLCPYSYHCHGLALDIIPLQRLNTLLYRALWGRTEWERSQYDTMASIAFQLEIDWGHRVWGRDKPHFHYNGNIGMDRVAVGELPPAPSFTPAPKPKPVRRAMDRLGIPVDGLL